MLIMDCPAEIKSGPSKQVLKGHNPARFISSPLKHVQPGRRENLAGLWPLGMFDLSVCKDPTNKELIVVPNKFLLCSSADGGNGSDLFRNIQCLHLHFYGVYNCKLDWCESEAVTSYFYIKML